MSHITFYFCRIMPTSLKGTAATLFKAIFLWIKMISNLYFRVHSLNCATPFPVGWECGQGSAITHCSDPQQPGVSCDAAPAWRTVEPCVPSVNEATSLGLPPLINHSSPWNCFSLMSLEQWSLSEFAWHLMKDLKISKRWMTVTIAQASFL